MPRLALIAVVIPVLLLTTWPAHPFVGHSHWQMIEWVPFSRLVAPGDVLANIALFIPLGFVAAWRRGWRGVREATILGASLSIVAELYQVYCHNAFPTTLDVLTNTLGTWAGAVLAYRIATNAEPRREAAATSVARAGGDDQPTRFRNAS